MPGLRRRGILGWLWRAAKLTLVAAVVAGAIYWVKFSPVAVESHRVARGPLVAEVMGTGTVEARIKSTISPKIPGLLQTIAVDQGDRVEQSQVLFKLDDAELVQQVEIAKAAVATSEAALKRLTADQNQAAAIHDQAQKSFQRANRLFEADRLTISEQEYDQAVEAFRISQAGLARAEAAILEGQKQLASAEKNLAYHQTRLADTKITAPYAGLVVKRHRDPGDVIVPGSPTLSLISTDEMWVSAWVDETEMGRLRVGQPARVVFRSEPERPYRGELVRLGREADRETREFVIDVHVLSLPENWAVGQRAEVFIETDRKDAALVLPARFLQWRDGASGVYRLDGDRAQWQPVRLGLRGHEAWEIAEGLGADDTVLLPKNPREPSLEGRLVKLPQTPPRIAGR